jgi:fructokinase
MIRYKTPPIAYGTGFVSLDIVISSDPSEPSYHWAGGTCSNVLTILSYLGWKSFPIARLIVTRPQFVLKQILIVGVLI